MSSSLFMGLVLLPLWAGGGAAWTFLQDRQGAEAHALVLAAHGGAYRDQRLEDHVASVGRRLADASLQERSWRFTILDTPVLTAFAKPGGQVYLSRGLLAFLRSDDELAAALAHQMAHALLGHVDDAPPATLSGTPGRDGLVRLASQQVHGARPVLRADQQQAAARLGVGILDAAGYDPAAAPGLADRLLALDAAKLALAGDGVVDMLGETLAMREVTARALAEAALDSPGIDRQPGPPDAFLAAIDGLVHGANPDHGVIRNGVFLHAGHGIALTPPEGFALQAGAARAVLQGPHGAMLVIDSIPDAGPRLRSYLRDRWAPELTRGLKAGYVYDLRQTGIGGFEAASGFQPYARDGVAMVAQLVVVRLGEVDLRLRAVARAEDFEVGLALEQAILGLRRMTEAERAAARPWRIRAYRVRQGDSLDLFAAALPFRDRPEERFRALNGYHGRTVPMVGDLVKLVME